MLSLVERTRNRLVLATLAGINDKTGSYLRPVSLSDGSVITIELDADILTKALKKLFEARVFSIKEKLEAEREISETYGDCVKIKSGKLTDIGLGFMSALISNLVEQAFSERGGK